MVIDLTNDTPAVSVEEKPTTSQSTPPAVTVVPWSYCPSDRAVEFRSFSHSFYCGRVKLRGITRLLKDKFYRTYSYKAATEGSGRETRHSDHVTNVSTEQRGAQLGSLVDEQIQRVFRLLTKAVPAISVAEFLNPSCDLTNRTNLARGDFLKLETWRLRESEGGMLVYTRKFLGLMRHRGWEPVASQVACGHVESKIGTAADFVVRDTRHGNRLVVVELKCGYLRYMHKHTKKNMAKPFTHLPDSPYFQFHLQLAFTLRLLNHTYPAACFREGRIVVVHEEGVTQCTLAKEVTAHLDAAWVVLTAKPKPKASTVKRRQNAAKKREQKAEAARQASREGLLGAIVPQWVSRAARRPPSRGRRGKGRGQRKA